MKKSPDFSDRLPAALEIRFVLLDDVTYSPGSIDPYQLLGFRPIKTQTVKQHGIADRCR